MKFTPRELEGNVNVSRTHPLVELAWLLGGLSLLAVAFYLVLGLLTDRIVAWIPPEVDLRLGQRMMGDIPASRSPALQQRLQALIDQLPPDSPLRQNPITAWTLHTGDANAVALPGGNIVIFSGLLEQVDSENALAMVLAHELGHIAHRDHLRGMGRSLGLTVASLLVFGSDSSATRFVSNLGTSLETSFSREQELAADAFALDLLQARYGHVGGASTFFERITQEKRHQPPTFFSTHPHPEARIAHLRQQATTKGYPTGTVEPLHREELVDAAGE